MVRVRGQGQEDDFSDSPPISKRSRLPKVPENVESVDQDDKNSGSEDSFISPMRIKLFK